MALYCRFPEVTKFLAKFPVRELADAIVQRAESRFELNEVEAKLNIYMNEVHVGWAVVKDHISKANRILEVGSGLGLLTAFLAERGCRILAIEPAAIGFDFFAVARNLVQQRLPVLATNTLMIPAEDLNPQAHGRFDFIFSVNVLEHVSQLERAMRALVSVMEPRGRMVHLCPNYLFPYEPHLGLPLLPFAPRYTSVLLPKELTEGAIWQSLNFITSGTVRRLADKFALEVTFKSGQLSEICDRLLSDDILAARHPKIARLIYAKLRNMGLARILEWLPARLQTPMMFEMRLRGGHHRAIASNTSPRLCGTGASIH